MIIAGVLTLVVPTGSYTREVQNGREIIQPDTYHTVARPDYLVWRWFTAPFEVLGGPDGAMTIVIIVFLLMVGVSFAVLDKSGILKYALARLVQKFRGRKGTAGNCSSHPPDPDGIQRQVDCRAGRHHGHYFIQRRRDGLLFWRWLFEPGLPHQPRLADLPGTDSGQLPALAQVDGQTLVLGALGDAGFLGNRGGDPLRAVLRS